MLNGRKVVQVTPGYCSAGIFDETRKRLADKWSGCIDEKWLLLNKYPLPSVDENEAALIEAASRHGYRTFDSGGDLGLQGSLNHFFDANPQPPHAIMLGIDGDSLCDEAGFDAALCEVLDADRNIAVTALGIPELANETGVMVGGHRVFYHPSMMMFNVVAWDLDFVASCGGFDQPRRYWGGIEEWLYTHLKRNRRRLVYLLDYNEARPDLSAFKDTRYQDWKWAHYYGDPRRFEEYLEA